METCSLILLVRSGLLAELEHDDGAVNAVTPLSPQSLTPAPISQPDHSHDLPSFVQHTSFSPGNSRRPGSSVAMDELLPDCRSGGGQASPSLPTNVQVDLVEGGPPSSPSLNKQSSLALIPFGSSEGNQLADTTNRVDWDAMIFSDAWEEEGRQDMPRENEIYCELGLIQEDEAEQRRREEAFTCGSSSVEDTVENVLGDHLADQPCEDYLPDERRVVYDRMNPSMQPGSLFPNMREFRIAMRQYAIRHEFELGIDVTSTTRYIGYCKGGDCPWRIYAREEKKGLPAIVVAVLDDVHKCTSSGRRNTTTPTSGWVAFHALPLLMKKPQMGAKELQSVLQEAHNVTIAYDTVWKGKEKALKELFGTWEESFQLLFSWREAVLAKTPDSVVEIDVIVDDGKCYFSRFFCALGQCISGFREGCRPYLSIDSTALNGRWNGQLASVTGVDGHNWMFPIAFGFFQSETVDNWTWFLTQLKKAVGDLSALAICSDAQKGLMHAVNDVFPGAEKRECFRHLMTNYVKSYSGSEHMYPAARAYRREVFEHHIDQVRIVPKIAEYLDVHHKFLWYRSGFNPEIKCDYITNNMAEVFNNWIKDYKDLPVCDLADKIREKIMELFHRRRRIGMKLEGKMLPSIIANLKARTRGLGHLSIVKSDNYLAEIRDSTNCLSKHIVKAEMKQCSCQEWQHTGKPCQHALALIIAQDFRDVCMENFVHEYYSVEKFKLAYSRRVEPIGDRSLWPHVDFASEVCAPIGKRGVGRQRKNRIKSCLEGGSGKKTSAYDNETTKKRIKRQYTCPNCGQTGHRKTSYKCPFNGTKKRKRKPRKNSTRNWIPKELRNTTSTNIEDATPSSPVAFEKPAETSSPLVVEKAAARKMTPKKKY